MSWIERWLTKRSVASPDHASPSGPLVRWCDYGPANPTWRFIDGGPRVTPVHLDALALSDETKDALQAWHRLFEEIWSPEEEPSDTEWDRFVTEGERLRDRVGHAQCRIPHDEMSGAAC
jgi:hypothetical protein